MQLVYSLTNSIDYIYFTTTASMIYVYKWATSLICLLLLDLERDL